ncbi:MAG TPA: hemerythrin domain-containing protein, partial [Candidatus Binataceae bacterium]
MTDQRQALLERHRDLLKTLHTRLERVREDPSVDHLRELVGCLEHDLLPHAEAERRNLYPALEPLIGTGGRAAADLDHELIRRFVGQVKETVDAIIRATETERATQLQYLDRIGSSVEILLIARLEKEEQIYLPLFSRFFPEQHQEAILTQIRRAGRGAGIASEAAEVPSPGPPAPPSTAPATAAPREHRRLVPADGRPIASLADYERAGGLAALRHVRHLTRDQAIGEISKSRLRGRGGAGFPTGSKWSAVAGEGSGTRYVCCNGAEGEPGTFKDRYLLYLNPFQVLEGLLIAAQVIGAPTAFFCIKRSFSREVERVRAAMDEFRAAGLAPDVDVQLVLGPEEYLFGEEKALLEVVEGNLPLPRVLPPYLEGLFQHARESNPTLIN